MRNPSWCAFGEMEGSVVRKKIYETCVIHIGQAEKLLLKKSQAMILLHMLY